MIRSHIWKYIISPLLFFAGHFLLAQTPDTLPVKRHHYKIGLGYDIGKKIWSQTLNGNIDQIHLNFNRDNHSLTLYLGRENMPYVTNRYDFITAGQYFKLEYAYNFFENWGDMQNEINIGIRYAQSFFNYDLRQIQIINPRDPSSEISVNPGLIFNNLQARWIELTANTKVEIFPRFYVELFISGKRFLSGTQPANFDLIYIPGFYQTNISGFGFGLGYGIAYRFGF